MARPEVTGKDNLPFDEGLFTSKQAREILGDGKTKFFLEDRPQLEGFLDGNKLKFTGRSIRELIQKKLDKSKTAARDVSQLTAAAMQARIQRKLEESAAATKAWLKQLTA
jgi:hypothetical protein